MKTLVLANQKGGVGKSAVAMLLAHQLAEYGQGVLAIDLDHQGNITSDVMRSNRATTAGLPGDRTLTEAVSVMPSASFVMRTLEREPTMHASFLRNLRNFLRRSTRTSTCGFQHQHLDYYLDELAFRFNRRRSRARGLLFHRLAQQAVAVGPEEER